jgi:hypothetical protein
VRFLQVGTEGGGKDEVGGGDSSECPFPLVKVRCNRLLPREYTVAVAYPTREDAGPVDGTSICTQDVRERMDPVELPYSV